MRAADAVLPGQATVLLVTSGQNVRHLEYPTFHRALYLLAPALILELILTFLHGAYPALQIMAMFSVAVAGLFLTRRAATFALYGAIPAFYLAAAGFLEGDAHVLDEMFHVEARGEVAGDHARTQVVQAPTASGAGAARLGGAGPR